MTDKIREKVINLFEKHRKQIPINSDEKVIRTEDGIYYVCVKRDDNGHYFDEKHLTERAANCFYMIRIMVSTPEYPVIYNYRVPANKLKTFLIPYLNEEKEGKIIEIEVDYPSGLA